ncbi:hypothetical protein FZW96_04770 [Bacillus sp. BGMRC 2118]|nr:hypothetical protein FZW96_04770 [Bacillus sp. BGMRC 2118]
MNNEKGSSLLLVMLVTLVFMVLGLSIITASVGGAKRTQLRNTDVVSTQDSVNTIEQVIAEFRVEMLNQTKYPLDERQIPDFNLKLAQFITALEAKYSITIESLTETGQPYDYIETSKYFTRVYKLTVDNGDKFVHQTLILSPTPSFIEYAAGSIGKDSNQGLHLNGSSYINGNVYANDIYLQNVANYKDNAFSSTGNAPGSFQTAATLFPSIKGNMYVQRYWNVTDRNKPHPITNANFEDLEEKEEMFYKNELPSIKNEPKDFIDVDFRKSFAERLNQLLPSRIIGKENIPALTDEDKDEKLDKLILDNFSNSAATPEELKSKLRQQDGEKYVLYDNNLTVTENINIPEDKWLIVHGNVTVFPFDKGDNPLTIEGNMLVTGDFTIAGNEEEVNQDEDDIVAFDSTIYALGKSTIHNTNIEGYNEKQLVLLSFDKLTVTRINEFTEIESDTLSNITPLKAFFYTDSEAELYGVGSLFYIHGGLFARDNLVINATRSNTTKLENKIISVPSPELQEHAPSRFNVMYDKDVLTDQLDALPRVERLQVVTDNLYIQAK